MSILLLQLLGEVKTRFSQLVNYFIIWQFLVHSLSLSFRDQRTKCNGHTKEYAYLCYFKRQLA